MQPNLRRVQRVRHELKRREVEVTAVERISPHFARVTFSGDALADFVSLSFDDHIKFIFDTAAGEQLRRDYTPRRFDQAKRTLTIEFALHGEGQACRWAEQVRVGQKTVIGGPKGSMIIPLDYDWHLLVGDATALPAISRRLEELPVGARARVIAMMDEADRRTFQSAANLDVTWVRDEQALFAALDEWTVPDGEGFAWAAGEASAMRQVRTVLVERKGHSRDAMRVAAYWRQGASDFHEDLTD